MKIRILVPHSPYLKSKSFHLPAGTMNTFWELTRSKIQETHQYFEKRFLKQVLDFRMPFKLLCDTSKLWNFVKIPGPYCILYCVHVHHRSLSLEDWDHWVCSNSVYKGSALWKTVATSSISGVVWLMHLGVPQSGNPPSATLPASIGGGGGGYWGVFILRYTKRENFLGSDIEICTFS